MLHLIFLGNNSLEFFCQGRNWRCCTFRSFLCRKFIKYFVHLLGILVRREREKDHLIFIIRRSSNSKFYKATSLKSSEKFSVEIILSKFGFLLELIWCMFNHSYLRHVDGKYRSATAPLVMLPNHIPTCALNMLTFADSLKAINQQKSVCAISWIIFPSRA